MRYKISAVLFLVIASCYFVKLNASSEKVALLFLTVSDLNHPNLWQTLIEESGDKFNIYVHSKEPMANPFWKNYRINNIVPTSWAIHVKAWQVLIQEAIKDPENTLFVFLSESCIPLYSLNHIYDVIMSDPKTHMKYGKPWWPDNYPREITELNPEYRYGNTEWLILNRKHAQIVAKDAAIIKIISRHVHDQESYFACLFAVYNCLPEVINHSYTYVNWQKPANGGRNPYSFHEINEYNNQCLKKAYSAGYLFARKFSPEYPESALMQMIQERD